MKNKKLLALLSLLSVVLFGLASPAFGEPISLALAATAAIAGTAAGLTAGGTAIVFGSLALTATLAGIAMSAFNKPKVPQVGQFQRDAQNRITMEKSTLATHKIIYGNVRISGAIVFQKVTEGVNSRISLMHTIIVLAGHEIEAIDEIYADDRGPYTLDADGFVTDESRWPYPLADLDGPSAVRIKLHLGAPDQEADPDLISRWPEWSTDHRLRGLPYVYIQAAYSPEAFPTGFPNWSFVVRGKKVYDPRIDSTAYSNNWALCVRDYITNGNESTDYDYGIQLINGNDFVDDDNISAAANVCEEAVTLLDGVTTQDRYSLNGVVDTEEKPLDVLDKMKTAGAGEIAFIQGKFKLFAGAYVTPTVTIDESWLAGEIEVQASVPRSDRFNAVKGTFVDPANQWTPYDYPTVTNATYEAEDGYQITRDYDLPFTTNVEAAQRIAKIVLENSRQGIVWNAPFNLKAMQLAVWDTVMVDIDQLGWSSKVFRITNWQLQADLSILMTLKEEASGVYDWNGGEATTIDYAPDTDLPDAGIVPAPGNPSVSERLVQSNTGSGLKTELTVSWSAPVHGFNNEYVLEYKLSADSTWTVLPKTVNTTQLIFDVGAGTYDFRVKAINRFQVSSDYATTSDVEVVGLTGAPEDITGFFITENGNTAILYWDLSPDIDVIIGGKIRIKHYNELSGATWSNSVEITPDGGLPGNATIAVVPLLYGTYLIKAEDSTQNLSVNAATITTNITDLLAMNTVAQSVQAPSFSGTKTSMVASGGILSMDGNGLFDDASGNFDDAAGLFDFGAGGGYTTSGSYTIDSPLDLGDVYDTRITIDIKAEIVNSGALWDSFGQNWDDITGLFDGDDLDGVVVRTFIRTTPDDPSGTPTWSAWKQGLLFEETGIRGIEGKLTVESEDATLNISITEFTLTTDVPTRLEKFEDAALLSGGNTLTYAVPFNTKPDFGISIQSTVSGDTPNYIHVTSGGKYTGVTVQILNGGSGAARTCDVYARGY